MILVFSISLTTKLGAGDKDVDVRESALRHIMAADTRVRWIGERVKETHSKCSLSIPSAHLTGAECVPENFKCDLCGLRLCFFLVKNFHHLHLLLRAHVPVSAGILASADSMAFSPSHWL